MAIVPEQPDGNELCTHSLKAQGAALLRPATEFEDERWGAVSTLCIRPDGSLRFLQVVMPRGLRMQFLDADHAGPMNGHPEIEKTRLVTGNCVLAGLEWRRASLRVRMFN